MDSAGLKTTGPLDTVADEATLSGSSKLAYNERPLPLAGGVGLVEFDIMSGCSSVRKVEVFSVVLKSSAL